MNDTWFLSIANATLSHLANALEAAFDSGEMEDVTTSDGVLTIVTKPGETFVINRHTPTHQIWLASPFSGGLHFSYNPSTENFQLADGRDLNHVLRHDLAQSGVEVKL